MKTGKARLAPTCDFDIGLATSSLLFLTDDQPRKLAEGYAATRNRLGGEHCTERAVPLLPEAELILGRDDECLDHLL